MSSNSSFGKPSATCSKSTGSRSPSGNEIFSRLRNATAPPPRHVSAYGPNAPRNAGTAPEVECSGGGGPSWPAAWSR
eukprot:5111735-Lingulodinium_polyedra.AAC.1